MMKYKYELILLLIVPPLLIARLTSFPPPWFDEGWVLSVARNWVKLGHYCQLMCGVPISASMLNVGFPAVAPIALSFRVFGVGVWQGRLPGVFFTIGSLLLIYHLVRELFSRSVARGTLAVLLFMSMGATINAIIVGRQAIGEMPSMFYLMAGYLCFMNSFRKPLLFLPFTCILWGLSVCTKLQALPFLTTSLATVLMILLFRQSWRLAITVGAALLGSLASFELLQLIQVALLHGKWLNEPGLYSITAFVPILTVRFGALHIILLLGSPTLIGMWYAAQRYLRNWRDVVLDEKEAVRLSILILAGTWTAWYVLLSVGWVRYLFSPMFLGSIFLALMLYELTEQFDFRLTFQRASETMGRRCSRRSIAAILPLLIISYAVPFTLKNLYISYSKGSGCYALDVVNYINKDTRPGSLIETYEMELFFLLDRPYHYPPNRLQIQLDRRTFLGQRVSISYDPMKFHPDYIVVGRFSRMWHLYESALKTGAFRMVRAYGPYSIYRRSNE